MVGGSHRRVLIEVCGGAVGVGLENAAYGCCRCTGKGLRVTQRAAQKCGKKKVFRGQATPHQQLGLLPIRPSVRVLKYCNNVSH
jgi:hypothetical protein